MSVVVSVTSVGGGVNSQVGEGTAPNVFFLGWYSFGGDEGLGERTPFNFRELDVLVPETARTFSYSLNFQSRATVTVKSLQKVSQF